VRDVHNNTHFKAHTFQCYSVSSSFERHFYFVWANKSDFQSLFNFSLSLVSSSRQQKKVSKMGWKWGGVGGWRKKKKKSSSKSELLLVYTHKYLNQPEILYLSSFRNLWRYLLLLLLLQPANKVELREHMKCVCV
jgi:hypothetical protein